MKSRPVPALAVAAVLVLAGCAGVSAPSGSDRSCAQSAFAFGGQENKIDKFEHLNVTITKITLKRESASSKRKRVRRDVTDRRVDLAKRQGNQLTVLANASVPDGTYKKLFLTVTDVNGTLTDGTTADVAVRKDRLKVKQQFVVSGDESLSFTVEPTVVRRDGRYVVKPLINKTGCSCC